MAGRWVVGHVVGLGLVGGLVDVMMNFCGEVERVDAMAVDGREGGDANGAI